MNIRYKIVTSRTLLGALAIFLAISQQVSSQTSNQSGLHFEDKSELLEFRRAGGEGLGGAAWLDFDNDGDLDLFLTNGRDNNRFNPEVLTTVFLEITMMVHLLMLPVKLVWKMVLEIHAL